MSTSSRVQVVLEGRSRRLGADRGTVGTVTVERRVQVDQIHTSAVHSPQDWEIIASPHGAGFEVGFTHLQAEGPDSC